MEFALIGHTTAGQIVAMLTSISAIIHATVALISGVDVRNPLLVGNTLSSPKTSVSEQRSRRQPCLILEALAQICDNPTP